MATPANSTPAPGDNVLAFPTPSRPIPQINRDGPLPKEVAYIGNRLGEVIVERHHAKRRQILDDGGVKRGTELLILLAMLHAAKPKRRKKIRKAIEALKPDDPMRKAALLLLDP